MYYDTVYDIRANMLIHTYDSATVRYGNTVVSYNTYSTVPYVESIIYIYIYIIYIYIIAECVCRTAQNISSQKQDEPLQLYHALSVSRILAPPNGGLRGSATRLCIIHGSALLSYIS